MQIYFTASNYCKLISTIWNICILILVSFLKLLLKFRHIIRNWCALWPEQDGKIWLDNWNLCSNILDVTRPGCLIQDVTGEHEARMSYPGRYGRTRGRDVLFFFFLTLVQLVTRFRFVATETKKMSYINQIKRCIWSLIHKNRITRMNNLYMWYTMPFSCW